MFIFNFFVLYCLVSLLLTLLFRFFDILTFLWVVWAALGRLWFGCFLTLSMIETWRGVRSRMWWISRCFLLLSIVLIHTRIWNHARIGVLLFSTGRLEFHTIDLNDSLLNCLRILKTIYHIVHWIVFQRVAICQWSVPCALRFLVCCVFKVSEVLPWETLELNTKFDEHGIVVQHNIVLLFVESPLNMETDIMNSTCTDVPTRSLELVRTQFHLVEVTLLHAFCDWFQARV